MKIRIRKLKIRIRKLYHPEIPKFAIEMFIGWRSIRTGFWFKDRFCV